MKKSSYVFLKAIIPLSALLIVSCELDVPVKEMITARSTIEEAYTYKADLHSPQELKDAESALLKTHEAIKKEKADDAKKNAEEARALAEKAIEKSLPVYSAEQLKKAEEAYTEADRVYAEKFSPEKFRDAGIALQQAKDLIAEGKLRESLVYSGQSYSLSVAAKNDSMGNLAVLENELNTLEAKLAELKKDKYSGSAADELATAESGINTSKNALQENDYKTATSEIALAKEHIDSAADKIMKKSFFDRIEKLRGDINRIREKELASTVTQNLDNAALALNGAEISIEKNNITDAETQIDQADKLIKESDSQIRKDLLTARIENIRNDIKTTKDMDNTGKHADTIAEADALAADGASLIENGSYNEAESKLDEAETVIAAVKSSLESESSDIAVKTEGDTDKEKMAGETREGMTGEKTVPDENETTVETKDEEQVYTVQWRKKNTDCLWRISQKVYKDASYWPAIYIANRDQIKDPDLIFPGQKFKIPPKPEKRPRYKPERDKKAVRPKNK